MVFYNKETMTERETIRAFCDGLKKAEYHAKEMAAVIQSKEWAKTAEMLAGLRENGLKLADMKAMTNSEINQAINFKLGNNGA